jgi:hypothetical protein
VIEYHKTKKIPAALNVTEKSAPVAAAEKSGDAVKKGMK